MDVKASRDNLEEMLHHSRGRREVPVVVIGEEVRIGFGGT